MNKNKIVTFRPVSFRSIFIDNQFDKDIFKKGYDQFFIHSLKEDKVHLRLPLPVHRKTVNDFLLITKGTCMRQVGIDSYELKAGDLLFVARSSQFPVQSLCLKISRGIIAFNDELLKHYSCFLELIMAP